MKHKGAREIHKRLGNDSPCPDLSLNSDFNVDTYYNRPAKCSTNAGNVFGNVAIKKGW